jgi:hypothetical protein
VRCTALVSEAGMRTSSRPTVPKPLSMARIRQVTSRPAGRVGHLHGVVVDDVIAQDRPARPADGAGQPEPDGHGAAEANADGGDDPPLGGAWDGTGDRHWAMTFFQGGRHL